MPYVCTYLFHTAYTAPLLALGCSGGQLARYRQILEAALRKAFPAAEVMVELRSGVPRAGTNTSVCNHGGWCPLEQVDPMAANIVNGLIRRAQLAVLTDGREEISTTRS